MIAGIALIAATLTGQARMAQQPVSVAVTYVVKRGDCLWSIEQAASGNGARWTALYRANRAVIGADPDLIRPGEKLSVMLGSRHTPGMAPGTAAQTRQASPRCRACAPERAHMAVSYASGAHPRGHLGCSGLETLWDEAGGNPVSARIAAAIAMAESGGNQYALSPTDDFGYWQVNASHGYLATFDPLRNARAAIIISDDGANWSPWTTYVTGSYRGRC